MNELNTLFAQYSLEELIVLIVVLLLAIQGIWRIIDFFYNKFQIRIGNRVDKIQWEQDMTHSLENINLKIDDLFEQNKITHSQQEQVDSTLSLVQERMQEDTRSYLIDAHHKFCYQFKKIDDLNLQSIERHYLYYKSSGGDSFVDKLIEDIRELPRVNFYTDVASDK